MSDATGGTASSAAAAKRAVRAEAQRRRRQNPEVRAAEAEARRRRREDPAVRAAEAEAQRRRRENAEVSAAEARARRRLREDPAVRCAEADAHRRRREDPTVRAAEAEAKRRKARLAKSRGATKDLQFTDNPFGNVCSVCERLSSRSDLKPLLDRCRETLQRAFPNLDPCQLKLCSTCMRPVREVDIPHLSTSNGCKYPPKPAHLLELNAARRREDCTMFLSGTFHCSVSTQACSRPPTASVGIQAETTRTTSRGTQMWQSLV